MRFSIVFTTDARDDLRLFRKGERKRLRPNQMAEWELRVDKFRVFYDIEESAHLVKVEAVGYKRGRRLLIHGEEYQL